MACQGDEGRLRVLDLSKAAGSLIVDADVAEMVADRAIYVGSHGYPTFSTHATGPVTLHSFVMGGAVSGMHIDHINGDKFDCRRANLRIVTTQANQINRRRLNRNNSSGTRGVQWVPRLSKWRAQITANRMNYHLGMFPTLELAVAARKSAELKHWGELAPCGS
jgi:hypothetical protein